MSKYETLAALDFGAHVETKGKFSYISWAWAVDQMSRICPGWTWEVKRFPTMSNPEIQVPYMETPLGFFVEVEVTVDGLSRSQIHPILNHQNKPVPKPNPFDVNTSIQRCLVKAIGLHGLGLYIYAGEDLPPDMPYSKKEFEMFKALVGNNEAIRLYGLQQSNPELYIALHGAYISNVPNGEKGKVRNLVDGLVKQGGEDVNNYITQMAGSAEADDRDNVNALINELDKHEYAVVSRFMTPELLEYIEQKEAA